MTIGARPPSSDRGVGRYARFVDQGVGRYAEFVDQGVGRYAESVDRGGGCYVESSDRGVGRYWGFSNRLRGMGLLFTPRSWTALSPSSSWMRETSGGVQVTAIDGAWIWAIMPSCVGTWR